LGAVRSRDRTAELVDAAGRRPIYIHDAKTYNVRRNRAIKATAEDVARFGDGPVWSRADVRIRELLYAEGFALESVGGPRLDFVLSSGGIWRVH
jgi:hypothetical protein